MRSSLAILIGIFAALPCARAAVRKSISTKAPQVSAAMIAATREALDLPLANRIQALESQGAQGYRNLVALMFDENSSMETRWRAAVAVGRIGGKDSLPELERAKKSREWFMRSASLVGASAADRDTAIKWSRQLLSDKALVVRTAAVDMLAELKDIASADLLWQKLYAKENYRRNQSLFIRRRIVEALAIIDPPGARQKFAEILNDKDKSLHPLAMYALSRYSNSTSETR